MVKLRNYLVSFASVLLDYVMGLVVRSCSGLMEESFGNVCLQLYNENHCSGRQLSG